MKMLASWLITFILINPSLSANCEHDWATIKSELERQRLEIENLTNLVSDLSTGRRPVIQSLSLMVPAAECINSCPFCCSRMRDDRYRDLYHLDYAEFGSHLTERLAYARESGVSTAILTGRNEPQQNWRYLRLFADVNRSMQQPFRKIEMQTTGAGLTRKDLEVLFTDIGVTTISLSVSALDETTNNRWNGIRKDNRVHLQELSSMIKDIGFTFRLSLNLTNFYETWTPQEILHKAKELGADQVTLRVFYESSQPTPQNRWIAKHRLSKEKEEEIHKYIRDNGRVLGVLEYGAIQYSIDGLSVVLDDDCMNKRQKNFVQKYWILRDDGKLYSQWDDPASLVF